MLIISVILSVALVYIIYKHYKNNEQPIYICLWLLVGVMLLGLGIGLFPALGLHCFAVLVGAILWSRKQWSARSLRTYMILAALPGYGIACYFAVGNVLEHTKVLDQLTFESIEDRLPLAKTKPMARLSNDTQEHLAELESVGLSHRSGPLAALHQTRVETFITSPGFGVQRARSATDWSQFTTDEAPTDQPGAPFASTLAADDFNKEPMGVDPTRTRNMHYRLVRDFVSFDRLGLVESRKKVLGFRPHRLSKALPADRFEWKIEAVELVSLLIHDEPAVDVSDKLPSMKDARKTPTRALNAFEAAGLYKLQDGDDFFVRDTTEGIRMLGAIRSIEQCVKCHGGERGDLLGAFSYRLQRVP